MSHWSFAFLVLAIAGAAGGQTGPCAGIPSRRLASLQVIDEKLRQVTALPPTLDNRLEVSRLLYYQAKYSDEEAARRALFERAMAITEVAMDEAPRHRGALLGFAAAKGEMAKRSGIFTGLRYVREIRDALVTLKEVDTSYAGYAADRGLGILFDEAPRLFSVGSTEKARESLRAANDGDAKHPGNRIALATFLARHDDRAAAVPLAKAVLDAADDPQWAVEAAEWVQQACEILGPESNVDGGG